MNDVNVCQFCGFVSGDEKDFKTDVDAGTDESEMTCENCYDEFNS